MSNDILKKLKERAGTNAVPAATASRGNSFMDLLERRANGESYTPSFSKATKITKEAIPYAEAAKANFTPRSEKQRDLTPVYEGVVSLYDKFGLDTGSRVVRSINDRITLSELEKEKEEAEEMYEVYSGLFGSGSTTPEEKTVALEQKNRFAEKLEEIEKKTARVKAGTRASAFAPDYTAIPKAPDFGVYGHLPQTKEPEDDMEEYLQLIKDNMERAMDGTPVAETERKDSFEFLSEDEKKTYYYLKNKRGEGAANSYLDNMAPVIAERRGAEIADTLAKEKGPARAAQTGGFALRSGFDQFGSGIIQAATDEVRPSTAVQIGAQKTREGLEDVGPKALGASLGQWGFDTAQTVGNMLPSMLISAGLGAAGVPAKAASLIGSASMGASAGGNTYAAAVREGMAPEDAREYGRLVGAAAGAMQYALGGIDKLSGGVGQKLARKAAGIENGLLRFIAVRGANAVSEAGEEALEAALEPVFRQMATDESTDIDWAELTYNALQGAITGFVLGGNGESGESGSVMTSAPAEGFAAASGSMEETKVVPPLPGVTKAGETKPSSSITEEAGRVPGLPTIASIRTQAEAIEARHAEFEKARGIAEKLGVELREESLGAGHHGKYENGVITVNSDSDNPVMETFVHELTHHLESSGNYDRLRRAAMDYVSNNMQADADSVIDRIVEEYAGGGIELDRTGAERELVAKFCAENVFTDEASIMRLARTDRNLFQRIYDWICDTITKLGSDSDTRALIDARRKYEKALRTLGETQSGNKHLYGGERARNADLKALSEARDMEAKGSDSEEIRQKTGWFRGADRKWRFEMDDSGMEISTAADGALTKLGDYIKHDKLFENYPELRNASLVFGELPEGVKGRYNSESNTITISESIRNAPERVLVHEIQHAVQNVEGFSPGTNRGYWQNALEQDKQIYSKGMNESLNRLVRFEAENSEAVAMAGRIDEALMSDDDGAEYEAALEEAEERGLMDAVMEYDELRSEFYAQKARPGNRVPSELYRDTAGEIEARDAARRTDYTARQRREIAPDTGNEDTVFAEGGVSYSIANEHNGRPVAVVDDDILSSIDTTTWDTTKKRLAKKAAKDAFLKFKEGVQVNGVTYKVNKISRDEYTRSLDTEILYKRNKGKFADKMRAADIANDVITATTSWAKDGGLKHSRNDNFVDFVHGKVLVQAGNNQYEAETIVGITDNGEYVFYDVVDMTPTSFKTKKESPTAAAGNKAVSAIKGDSPDDSIANDTSDVKASYGSSLSKQVEAAGGKKAEKKPTDYRPTMAKRDLRRDLLGFFSVAEGNRAAMGNIIDGYADRLIKNGEISADDRQWLFDALYESGAVTVKADEYLSIGRGAVAGGRIYVDESTRDEFGDDWNDFRRRAFGAGVYLTSDKADMGPDSWYSELAPMLPGLFDAGETDARAMLENIVRVAEEGKDRKMSLRDYTAMVAEQEHVSEDQFIEHMERQVDWALRAFGEKAGLELWFKKTIDDKVQRERERSFKTRQEQMQRQRENRELRELQQRTLKQLQWLSKNRNKAPEDLRAAWDEVLGDIDIYAINAANEMNWSDKHQATWKDLAQLYKDAKEHDPNFLPSKELEQIVSRLDDRKIGEMDVDALSDLYKAAVGLRTEFYNRKNVIADENHRLFADVYADAKEEITTAPGGYTGKGVDKLFNIQQLTPMNVFQRMAGWNPNSTWYSMGRQLEKGERDMRAYHVEANRQLETFLTENEDWVKRADGQGKDAIWYEIEVPELLELNMGDKPIFGDSVKVYMTPAQKVHLYLESKSEDNLRHMTGGRTFVDKELYSKGERREALAHGKTIKLAPETVKKIVSDMTPVEMELAKLLEGYYNSFAKERINRISNILYGFDKAVGRNYAPIYTNKNYTKAEIGTFDTTAEGVGNLKARQYSKNPSYNLSAFDAFERHVDQTARFVGMAIPARNWTTLLNWRESNNSMADVLTHKWGEEGKNYITGLIENLQAGKVFEKDVVSETADKVFSKYVSAVFGANPSIVLKQLGSIPLASAYLDAKNFPTPAQVAGIDRTLIGKYTSELDHRTMGYSMPETKLLKDNPGWTDTNKFVNFTFGGGAITAMDGWAASTLWPWAENKVRRDFPGLEVGTQEQIDSGKSPFYQKVAELYNDALTRTQSVSDETHQSTIRKSKNPLTRTFTMFKSDAAQGYNVLRQKVGEAQYYKRTGADSATRSRANRSAGGAVLALASGYMYAQGINFLINLWKQQGKKYKDEEEGLNFGSVAKVMCMDLVSDFAGMVVGGGELAEVIGNVLTGEKWYGIETPGTEQLADLAETIMQSLSELGGVVGDAASVLKQGGNVSEYLSSRSGDILGVVKDAAQTIATYIGGVSVNNVEAYLLGALKWISPKVAEAYEAAFDSTTRSDLSSLSGDALAVRVNGILESRLDEVAPETVDVLAYLYESGYKGAVPGDVPKTLTADGEEISLNIYQQQLYNTVWSGAVRGTVDEVVASEAFTGADEQAREKMLKKLYDYAAQKAKAEVVDGYEADLWISEMDEALSEGVDMGDYLRGAAIESAAKGTKDEEGETITGSKAVEVMHQIDEMELSEVEKIELFASLGYEASENMWTSEYKGDDYEAFYYMSKSGRSGYLEYCDWLPVAEYAEYYEAYSNFMSDKDANGKTVKAKKEKVIEYIDRLDLTDDQKSALFVSFGYAMSSLEDCIWYNPIAMRSRYFPVG